MCALSPSSHEIYGNKIRAPLIARCFISGDLRLERNQEREKEAANLEYLKNVILQFIKCRPSEREHLVPVLTTMLKLSQDEKDLVAQQARGRLSSQAASFVVVDMLFLLFYLFHAKS